MFLNLVKAVVIGGQIVVVLPLAVIAAVIETVATFNGLRGK